jgi:hypothetical protein
MNKESPAGLETPHQESGIVIYRATAPATNPYGDRFCHGYMMERHFTASAIIQCPSSLLRVNFARPAGVCMPRRWWIRVAEERTALGKRGHKTTHSDTELLEEIRAMLRRASEMGEPTRHANRIPPVPIPGALVRSLRPPARRSRISPRPPQ